MAFQFLPTFIRGIDWQKEGLGVCGMNQDWKTEFATGRPDRIPAGVIDSDECSIGVAIDQPQVFKDFQATGPLPLGILKMIMSC